ncbi:L-threonine ammonia-lyase [Koleobacter methoxysyntrophicus]|jgi:threonine dehydratase|uniref:L-threonine dehydratase catabolic TdcB n=1 Tax=Koleobacter methoxysyntrophicus TaxID=2751313 RepID=A0A8A0RKV7_9FIRM|nr:threonine ammonia-lyase [Koleobacter methoxysyntrophicus]QSQ08522.1 L-threonine ammonia-lyase [Koleobacter methoxysyntrophicus]
MESSAITLGDIKRAYERLKGTAKKTTIDESRTLSEMTGNRVFLKAENLQKTGAFKIRGAFNKIMSLTGDEKAKGVIAASAGNHAQGVALAATSAGILSTIVMPEGAPVTKVTATKGYGASVILWGQSYDDAYKKALEIQSQTGATFVHAFDDPDVIAGQGTIALEILEEIPETQYIIVPVGGGGLISGIAVAAKALKPDIKVIGVQAEGAASAFVSRSNNRITELASVRTIADGIAVKKIGKLTFSVIQKYVDDIVTVKDEEIAHAILNLLERSKLVVEGAGAVGVAALMYNKIDVKNSNIVVLLSGGNIDVNMISRIIEKGLIESGRYIRLATVIPDQPGTLNSLLKTVASVKANVISVFHNRARQDVAIGQAEVELELETRDSEHASQLIQLLKKQGYRIKIKDI